MAARKAASVLPDSVGAATSVCRPAWIAGQASACAGVGPEKLPSNQWARAEGKRGAALMEKTKDDPPSPSRSGSCVVPTPTRPASRDGHRLDLDQPGGVEETGDHDGQRRPPIAEHLLAYGAVLQA